MGLKPTVHPHGRRANLKEGFFPLPPALNFRPYTVYSHTGPAVPGVVHDLRLALGPGKLKDIRESNLAMIDQTLKTPWPEVEQDAGRAFGM